LKSKVTHFTNVKVELIKNGGNSLAIQCFKDHPGQVITSKNTVATYVLLSPLANRGKGAEPLFPFQPLEAPKDQDRKKGKGGKTVSSYFKGQLDDLMTTLYKTHPHFIRCVVPNTHKIPGGVEPGLVMHQYQCNGVLAGIAICRGK